MAAVVVVVVGAAADAGADGVMSAGFACRCCYVPASCCCSARAVMRWQY